MAERRDVEYPKDSIMVNLNCPDCDKSFNAIIDRDSFDGSFDDNMGGRVQYVEMRCAGCDRVLVVEIPYLTSREEAASCPKVSVSGGSFAFCDIPAYCGKVVNVHD